MKHAIVLPCQMPKIDDDESPRISLWRVVVNGAPHREWLRRPDPVMPENPPFQTLPEKHLQ